MQKYFCNFLQNTFCKNPIWVKHRFSKGFYVLTKVAVFSAGWHFSGSAACTPGYPRVPYCAVRGHVSSSASVWRACVFIRFCVASVCLHPLLCGAHVSSSASVWGVCVFIRFCAGRVCLHPLLCGAHVPPSACVWGACVFTCFVWGACVFTCFCVGPCVFTCFSVGAVWSGFFRPTGAWNREKNESALTDA